MKIIKIRLIVCFIAIYPIHIHSQTFEKPNYALKSHETLEIRKIELTPEKTIVSLSVENRIVGGQFCADRNIYLIDSDGERFKLKKSSGIPVCPATYQFKSIGEQLQFTLEFSPLKAGRKWIDIIEDCTSNCFWFYGVTLDNELNKKLDEAFILASKQNPAETINQFRNILDDIDSQNLGIEGLLFINIINAALREVDNVNAAVWYKRLAASHAPRLNQYLKYLNDKGIKY